MLVVLLGISEPKAVLMLESGEGKEEKGAVQTVQVPNNTNEISLDSFPETGLNRLGQILSVHHQS